MAETRTMVKAPRVPAQAAGVVGLAYRAPAGVRLAATAPDPARLPDGPLRSAVEELREVVARRSEVRDRIDAAVRGGRDAAATEDAHALADNLDGDGGGSRLAKVDAALVRDAQRLLVLDGDVARAEDQYHQALAATRADVVAHVDAAVAKRDGRLRKSLNAAVGELDAIAEWDRVGRALGRRESGARELAESLRALLRGLDRRDPLAEPFVMGDTTRQARLDELRANARIGDKRSADRRGQPGGS